MLLIKGIVVILGVTLFAPPTWSQAIDTMETRTAAAKRYAKTFDFTEMMGQSFQALAQTMPPDQRDDFVRFANGMLHIEEFEAFTVGAIVRLFDTNEINKLADFYGSPEGQSIIKKMPQFMTVILPYTQQMAIRSVERYMQEQQKRQRQPRKS